MIVNRLVCTVLVDSYRFVVVRILARNNSNLGAREAILEDGATLERFVGGNSKSISAAP